MGTDEGMTEGWAFLFNLEAISYIPCYDYWHGKSMAGTGAATNFIASGTKTGATAASTLNRYTNPK